MVEQTFRIDRDHLRRIISYDPQSGLFTSLAKRGSKIAAGDIIGHVGTGGYIYFNLKYRKYLAHRVAWFYMTGEWPEEVDHINGNPSDNRWENLRLATHRQNLANTGLRATNSTGYRGVSKNRGKYQAQIRIDGKRIMLGRFDTPEEASEVYEAKARELFGEFHRAAA